MSRRLLPAVLLPALVVACMSSPAPRAVPEQRGSGGIDTLAIRAYSAFLSDDLLLGRATGSAGARTAALYISSACRSIGLDPIATDFALPVPLEVANFAGSELVEDGSGREQVFRAPADFAVQGGTSKVFKDATGRAVLVGGQNDIVAGNTPSLTGAIAVTLGLISGAAFDTLMARGAVAALHLTSDGDALHRWADREGSEQMYVADTSVRSSYYPNIPSIIAGPSASRALLAGRQSVAPGPIDASITLRLRADRRAVPERNVGCLLRGGEAALADTAIVFTAHYDHLGVGAPDAHGDSIYNGFSDDAAGVAMVLAIAGALRRGPDHPRHSMLFLFFTGEERGLLGSDYYVARPAWPLARTAAVINLDAGAPPALVWSWRVAGGDGTPLGRLAVDVALSGGWSAVTSGPRANSDYFPFVRMGVPAIFLVPGPAPYQGLSADSSQSLRQRWDHYHQPSDEWKSDFPFSGLGRYAEFALRIAQALDRRGR